MAIEKTEFSFPDEQAEGKEPVAGKEQELDIEVIDDTPVEDRNRKPMTEPPQEPTDEELAGYSESVRKRFQHFTKGFHEERRAKEASQRERDEALRMAKSVIEENNKLKGSLSTSQQAIIDQAKNTVANEIENAKRKYKDAMEAFDTEATISAQQELMSAQLKAERINNFRPAPLQQVKPDVQTTPQQQAPQVDAKTREWNERNKWFGPDRKKTAYAIGVHEELVSEGIQAGSDEYFRKLDRDLQERFPEPGTGNADAPTQRTSANVVASATRSTAPRKIVLSKTQVDIAKRLGVPLELYARKVAEEMRK